MNCDIYNFKNYRLYLESQLKLSPKKGHGLRSVWAKAMGCQVAFVSHVLNGLYDLSIEQGEALSRHLGLNTEETEFFLMLIQKERAGTHQLKKFYAQWIQKKIEHRENIRERVKINDGLNSEDQMIYYSTWVYAAVRILLTIPEFKSSPEKIAQYFNLPLSNIRNVLDFLETRNLIAIESGQYQLQRSHFFIDKNSPLYPQQQIQWRQRAIESIYQNNKEHVHYSNLFSISETDVKKIKDIILKSIEDSAEIIKPSKEEKIYSMCMDLFEVR